MTRTLFERLQGAGGAGSQADLLSSILQNMADVLNSRAGCCQTRTDYGMPDFNSLVGDFPNALPVIARAVEEQVRAFEPRLRDVSVLHVPDPERPLDLRFQITGRAVKNGIEERVRFDTVVGDDGHTLVR